MLEARRSISPASRHRSAKPPSTQPSASRAACSARSAFDSPTATCLLSMPVRVLIHSSFVSTSAFRSSFCTSSAGTALPNPTNALPTMFLLPSTKMRLPHLLLTGFRVRVDNTSIIKLIVYYRLATEEKHAAPKNARSPSRSGCSAPHCEGFQLPATLGSGRMTFSLRSIAGCRMRACR